MRKLASLVIAAALTTCSLPVLAAPAKWAENRFVYRADGKKLSDVLMDFGASQSIPVIVDPAVEGTVNASFNSTGTSFLNAIGKTYGVIWYYDGVTLFVYPARAIQSRVFKLRGFDRSQVRHMLDSFGLGDTRYPLRYNESEQTVFVSGPPRHMELVSTAIETLEQNSKERSGNVVKVVPLRYAVAADRNTGNSTLVGLAATLNKIYGGKSQGSGVDPVSSVGAAVNNAFGDQPASATPLPSFDGKRRALEQTYGYKSPSQARAGGPRQSGDLDSQ